MTAWNPLDLSSLFYLDDGEFRQRFRRTALWRAKRRGLLRNAAVVLGNQRPPQAIDPLCHGLADAEPLVRAACAWALGQYADPRAAAALNARLQQEPDAAVRDEIVAALAE